LPAERTEPGVEAAVAAAIAIVEPVGAALVPAGADQPFDIGFHQDLPHRRHGSPPPRIAAATDRRKSPAPLFGSSSTSAISASVLGSSLARGDALQLPLGRPSR
jgi:hypothetical protein